VDTRLAATALTTFAADVDRHLSSGPCAASGLHPVIHVPDHPGPREEGWL
jgi:hypothetical protein